MERLFYGLDLYELDGVATANVQRLTECFKLREADTSSVGTLFDETVSMLMDLIPIVDGNLIVGEDSKTVYPALNPVRHSFGQLTDPFCLAHTKAEKKAFEKKRAAVCRMYAAFAMGYARAMSDIIEAEKYGPQSTPAEAVKEYQERLADSED